MSPNLRWHCGPENNVVACFLATHIKEPARLDSLRNSMRSIKAQTTTAQLYVSWSAADSELQAATRLVLKQEGTSLTTCYMHKKTLTQFQHYKFLAEKVRDADAKEGGPVVTWVLFSDDDDVWHPLRLQFYCMLLETVDVDERARSQAVTCPWWAIRAKGHEALAPVSSADEVEAHMHAKRWFLQDFSRHVDGVEACEHWCSLVKLTRVLQFFEMAPTGLVSSTFCDVAFARFFCKGHDEDVHTFRASYQEGFPWLYAYNASADLDVQQNILMPSTHGDGRESGGPSHASADPYAPTAEEHAVAERMLPALVAQFPEANRDVTIWAKELARQRRTLCVVAATRLWIPSTVALREESDGPAFKPREKARAIAGLCFSDFEVIWRKHSHTPRERALKLFILDYHGGVSLRAALRDFGFEHADLISDAWEAQCAKLKDAACLKDCGALAPPSGEHAAGKGGGTGGDKKSNKGKGGGDKKGGDKSKPASTSTAKPKAPPVAKKAPPPPAKTSSFDDLEEIDDEPRIVEIDEPRIYEAEPRPAAKAEAKPSSTANSPTRVEPASPTQPSTSQVLLGDEPFEVVEKARAREIKSLLVHAVTAVEGVGVRAVAAVAERGPRGAQARHEVGRAATAVSYVARRARM